MKLILCLIVAGVLITTPCFAFVLGGSNFDLLSEYPKHKCYKTVYSKPIRPYRAEQWEIDFYNSEVERYNASIREYYACLKEYLENAKLDIDRITEIYNDIVKSEFK